PRHPRTPPFPYTTLFRSAGSGVGLTFSGSRLNVKSNPESADAEPPTNAWPSTMSEYPPGARVPVRAKRFESVTLMLKIGTPGKKDRKSTRLNSSHQIISY